MRHIIDSLNNKNTRILIPGAGNAFEADYLIEKGFQNVTILDIASQPLRSIQNRNRNTDRLKLIQEDFFKHPGIYDLILEQTFFCALEVRFRESYAKKIHSLLSDHGELKGVLFNFEAKRDAPPFSASKEEYFDLFDPLFKIIKLEMSRYSEPERAGKELYVELKKRNHVN
jgi:thiopurine S-methyltransferase